MKNLFSKLSRKWKRIRYSKKIVTFCIVFIVLYTALQTYLSYELQVELSPTLTTCVYAFFGTELAACAIVRVFDNEDAKKKVTRKSTKAEDTEGVG